MTSPELSVLYYFRNDAALVESVLSKALRFKSKAVEWIFIDDASTDETPSILESLVEASGSDDIFLYTNETYKGRAQSINEAIGSLRGRCLWLGSKKELPDFQRLLQRSQQLSSQKKILGLQQPFQLPQSMPGWTALLQEGVHIPDELFLWNIAESETIGRFFNPYLHRGLMFDLGLRLCGTQQPLSLERFIQATEESLELIPASDLREMAFGLLRHPKTTEPQRVHVFEMISPVGVNTQSLSEEEIEELLHKAEAFIDKNDLPASINICDRILRAQPYHEATLLLKVSLLEKLKQFVEASELKHRIKQLQRERDEVGKSIEAEHEKEKARELADKARKEEEEKLKQESDVQAEETPVLRVVELSKAEEDNALDADAPERKPVEQQPPLEPDYHTTIIIPTTGGGRPALEHCLTQLHHFADPRHYKLIIIDNGSQDDTFELLEQLEQQAFLQVKVLKNKVNKGVAAAYAQGLNETDTPFALFLHTDCLLHEGALDEMHRVMLDDEQLFICGPKTNTAPLKAQLMQAGSESSTTDANVSQVDYLDGCCLYVRTKVGLKPDESFYPAYFEDMDLCWQARAKGGKCAVATHAQATHHKGYTTHALGWDQNSAPYWKNAALFAKKWGLGPEVPEKPSAETAPVVLFAQIGEVINPHEPEAALLEYARGLITAELKSQMRQVDAPIDKLYAMISLAALLDERELVRTLEEKLNPELIDAQMLRLLCTYYFNKNIFSRMRTYFSMFDNALLPQDLQILYLDMLIRDKEFDEATPIMEYLYQQYPNHPYLNAIAAGFYRFVGEHEQAVAFKEKARALDPLSYSDLN